MVEQEQPSEKTEVQFVEEAASSVRIDVESNLSINVARGDKGEHCHPYDHYLMKASSGDNLQELIKQLVDTLNEKDRQIDSLKVQIEQSQTYRPDNEDNLHSK